MPKEAVEVAVVVAAAVVVVSLFCFVLSVSFQAPVSSLRSGAYPRLRTERSEHPHAARGARLVDGALGDA